MININININKNTTNVYKNSNCLSVLATNANTRKSIEKEGLHEIPKSDPSSLNTNNTSKNNSKKVICIIASFVVVITSIVVTAITGNNTNILSFVKEFITIATNLLGLLK